MSIIPNKATFTNMFRLHVIRCGHTWWESWGKRPRGGALGPIGRKVTYKQCPPSMLLETIALLLLLDVAAKNSGRQIVFKVLAHDKCFLWFPLSPDWLWFLFVCFFLCWWISKVGITLISQVTLGPLVVAVQSSALRRWEVGWGSPKMSTP